MRFREAAIVFCAVVSLAASPAAFAQASEPSVVDGIVNFFRHIFATDEKEVAPAAAPAPSAPAGGAPGAGQPQARTQSEAESVKAAPIAMMAPTSLHAVVVKGDFEAARKLIEQGADVEAKDPGTGASVLHYAVMRGNPDILKYLLAKGADVNSRTRNGTTPLHTAVLYNRYEVAEMLLGKGADVDAKSGSGATPLAIATAARNREMADLLRARGAK